MTQQNSQIIAQSFFDETSAALNTRPLIARLEHSPIFYGQYWLYAASFTYEGVECRCVVTVYVEDKAPSIAFYARSDEWPKDMGYRWGATDNLSVTDMLERVPSVLHQARNEDAVMRNHQIADNKRRWDDFCRQVDSGEIQRKIDECRRALAEEAENKP